MFYDVRRFIERNLPPIGVLAVVILGLVFAAQISQPPSQRGVPRTGEIAPPAWRSLPPATQPLQRIGFGSCFRQDLPAPIWTAIAKAKPELFLMMGDNVYGDVRSPDLRELIGAYKMLAAHKDFRPVVTALPFLATWDDHDYGANDGGADFVHRAASLELFKNFWKGSGTVAAAAAGDGVQNAHIFGPVGQRIQIILLDTRSFRSPLKRRPRGVPGKGKYLPDDTPSKTMLGDAQWQWLAAELKKPAELRLLVSSIQVIADGHGFERWGNLPRERQKLFDTIRASGANGVVLLSGDRHRAAIYEHLRAIDYPLYEVTSSALNLSFDDPAEVGPHQLHRMYGRNNFGMVTIDWSAKRVALTIRDQNGGPVREQVIDLGLMLPRVVPSAKGR